MSRTKKEFATQGNGVVGVLKMTGVARAVKARLRQKPKQRQKLKQRQRLKVSPGPANQVDLEDPADRLRVTAPADQVDLEDPAVLAAHLNSRSVHPRAKCVIF